MPAEFSATFRTITRNSACALCSMHRLKPLHDGGQRALKTQCDDSLCACTWLSMCSLLHMPCQTFARSSSCVLCLHAVHNHCKELSAPSEYNHCPSSCMNGAQHCSACALSSIHTTCQTFARSSACVLCLRAVNYHCKELSAPSKYNHCPTSCMNGAQHC